MYACGRLGDGLIVYHPSPPHALIFTNFPCPPTHLWPHALWWLNILGRDVSRAVLAGCGRGRPLHPPALGVAVIYSNTMVLISTFLGPSGAKKI